MTGAKIRTGMKPTVTFVSWAGTVASATGDDAPVTVATVSVGVVVVAWATVVGDAAGVVAVGVVEAPPLR